jgi:uncharacterized protein (TIGR00299 family) protein
MARPRLVALYTDFGHRDVYAGVLRAILRTLAPESEVVDICHEVPSGDRHAAAFMLLSSVPYLPRGTIHLCVVDPGVGTSRMLVAVRAGGHTFIGPDNGVFAPVIEALGGVTEARYLTNEKLQGPRRGATFHGRDVMAPVAAHLVRGIDFANVGERAGALEELPGFAPDVATERVSGRVLHVAAHAGRAVGRDVRRRGAGRAPRLRGQRRLPRGGRARRKRRGETPRRVRHSRDGDTEGLVTSLYLDCFSGVAGDMLVGALLDLGASFDAVESGLARLGVEGYRLERRSVKRGAIAATKFEVHLSGHEGADPGAVHDIRSQARLVGGGAAGGHHHHHADEPSRAPHDHSHEHHHEHDHAPSRGLREIAQLIEKARLPQRAASRALAAFRLLAEAEGRVHGVPPETVHFHEVGAVDAICDIVGACLALEDLGVERVFVGPLRAGSGFVKCEHGSMPVPAPGTLGCLTGFDVRFEEGRGELVTPTGACLVGSLAKPGLPPSFVVARVGYGAGTRDPHDVPNVLRAVLGDVPAAGDAETVYELSTNLDHVAPTVLAVAVDAALAAGALDASVVPCTMKKGRPGHLLTALVPASRRDAVESALFAETGTLGIRRVAVERTVLAREFVEVDTSYGVIRVKIGRHGGRVTSCVPEFEDCRAAAERAGAPVAEVIDAARRAVRR